MGFVYLAREIHNVKFESCHIANHIRKVGASKSFCRIDDIIGGVPQSGWLEPTAKTKKYSLSIGYQCQDALVYS